MSLSRYDFYVEAKVMVSYQAVVQVYSAAEVINKSQVSEVTDI